MATTTYINDNMETLATAMQQLVTMGYFASVEYDSENSAVVCYDVDENAVLTIKSTSGTIRLDDGTTKSWSFGGGGMAVRYLYVCSGGAYLDHSNGGNYTSGVIISKTNNDKIGCIAFGTGSNTGQVSQRVSNVISVATNDDVTQINTGFAFGLPTTRYQTTLMNIPTCGAPNVVSYFPDVFYTFTSQYPYTNNTATPPQNFTQDGKRYLWIGYYAITDAD